MFLIYKKIYRIAEIRETLSSLGRRYSIFHSLLLGRVIRSVNCVRNSYTALPPVAWIKG